MTTVRAFAPRSRSPRAIGRSTRQRGVSLVELMVASAIGLAITAAIVGVFVQSSRARTEIDRSNRQIENGRYALELLGEELRLAGFYGELPMAGIALAEASACATNAAQLGWDAAASRAPVPVQSVPSTATDAACLADRSAGDAGHGLPASPALAIRRVSTEEVAVASIAAGNEYLQTSRCAADPPATRMVVSGTQADFTLRDLPCTAATAVRRIVQRTYYIASCSNCGADTIPSLKRVELVGGALQSTTMAEGIEAMGIELGFDTDADGAPDEWRLQPDPDATTPAGQWGNVMAVRVRVLSRTTEPTGGHVDTRKYDLGLASEGTSGVGPFNDAFKRRVHSMVIRLVNPAGLRES